MEPITLATTVISLIAPYLTKAGETMVKKVGEAAWEKVQQLYTAVKDNLTGDPYAEQTLERLKENPESESRQKALVGVLEEKIQDDSTFSKALQELLAGAKEAGAEAITQQITVSDHARTGDITAIGKIEGGSVNLSKKR